MNEDHIFGGFVTLIVALVLGLSLLIAYEIGTEHWDPAVEHRRKTGLSIGFAVHGATRLASAHLEV